jgi:hypothetical protein
MIPVIIESPLKADTDEGYERNREYARACMRDSLSRGEAPYASHLLYAQPGILDDTDPREREMGILAGFAHGALFKVRVFYLDLGMSKGMQRGWDESGRLGQIVETRFLKGKWTRPDPIIAALDLRAAQTEIV